MANTKRSETSDQAIPGLYVSQEIIEALARAVADTHDQQHAGPACFCRQALCEALAALVPGSRWSIPGEVHRWSQPPATHWQLQPHSATE